MRFTREPPRGACRIAGAFLFGALAGGLAAEEPPAPPPEPPRVLLVTPAVLRPGPEQEVVVRGLRLDQTERVCVEFPDGVRQTVEPVAKQAAEIPAGAKAETAGDTAVRARIAVPEGAEAVVLQLESAAGRSSPVRVPVLSPEAAADEQEPNDGFAAAQELASRPAVFGAIGNPRDVDVYLIRGEPGAELRAEVLAREADSGSLLDPAVTAYGTGARLLRFRDDDGEAKDPVLTVRVPADGRCYLVIQDAQDGGSGLHSYLLRVRLENAVPARGADEVKGG